MKKPGIPRRTRLSRSRSSIPRTAVRPRNAKRQAREFARAYGSAERVEWIKGLPSVASGEGPCVNAHVKTGGGSRKADACWIVPLTDFEHRIELHHMGKADFNAKYGIDLDTEAQRIQQCWEERTAA